MKAMLIALLFILIPLAALGVTSNVSVHGSHPGDATAVDDTLIFKTEITTGVYSVHPISAFYFSTEQDMDLIILFQAGGSQTYGMKAGDCWSPKFDDGITEITLDVTGATTYDFYW